MIRRVNIFDYIERILKMLSPVRKVQKFIGSESSTESIITAKLIVKEDFNLNSPSVLEASLNNSFNNQSSSLSSVDLKDLNVEVMQSHSCKCVIV